MTGPPAASVSVAYLERIAAAGWPGIEQGHLGQWVLRAGGGFTGRANSALPLGDPGMSCGDALDAVRRFYARRALPARIQVPIGTAAAEWRDLDERLATWQWTGGDEAAALVADLDALTAAPTHAPTRHPGITAEFSPDPTREWLRGYRYRGAALPAQAEAVLTAGGDPVFAALREAGSVVAVARGIVTDGWLGVTALEVAPASRRRGLATRLMAELFAWARDRAAGRVYLQVAAGNATALEMYRTLGFAGHHRYHYRTAPAGSC